MVALCARNAYIFSKNKKNKKKKSQSPNMNTQTFFFHSIPFSFFVCADLQKEKKKKRAFFSHGFKIFLKFCGVSLQLTVERRNVFFLEFACSKFATWSIVLKLPPPWSPTLTQISLSGSIVSCQFSIFFVLVQHWFDEVQGCFQYKQLVFQSCHRWN